MLLPLPLPLSLSYPSLKRKLRSLHLKCSYIHARHSSVKRQQLYPPLIHPSAQQATSLKYYVGNRQIHAQTRTRIRMQDTDCAKLYALLNYNAKILSSILAAKCNYITKLVTFWSLQVCSTWLAQSSNENWERERVNGSNKNWRDSISKSGTQVKIVLITSCLPELPEWCVDQEWVDS